MARGRVYKRGASWGYVIDVPPPPGKARKQHYGSGYPTRKAAERALAELQTELARGEFVEPATYAGGVPN